MRAYSELVQTAGPTPTDILNAYPVAQAKKHLRISNSVEDSLIEGWIQAAYWYLFGEEGYLNHCAGLQETYLWSTDEVWSGMELPMRPLRTVTFQPVFSSIQADGSYAAIGTTRWVTIANRIDFPLIARVPNTTAWPAAGIIGHPKAFTVEFAVGLAPQDGDDPLPPRLVQAMSFLIGHLYQNREATYEDFRITAVSRKVELGVDQFAGAYRLCKDHS